MEVMMTPHNVDFDFNSAIPSTPTGPSNPYYESRKCFAGSFEAADDPSGGGLASTAPFDWEDQKKVIQKSPVGINNTGNDFAFDVSQEWITASLSAEELFDGGVIKPLRRPPQAPKNGTNVVTSLSERLSETRKSIQGAFSKPKTVPSAAAVGYAARTVAGNQRGRLVSLSESLGKRASRSLSPLRDRQHPWNQAKEETEGKEQLTVCSALSASTKGQKKWRLKDFFLFRSASEGRAADKDLLKKYTAAVRHSSIGAIESTGSGSRRRGPVSAHELHYKANRAMSEDLKKRTFLPYKQGILGCVAFNPAIHALANGFGFPRK